VIRARGPHVDVEKMARWLPYHRDRLCLLMAKAMAVAWGAEFHPEYKPEESETPKDPETVKAVANRELDSFRHRAEKAIRAYKQQKGR